MNESREKPFEYLRRISTKERFESETVKSWYEARAYVLRKLSETAFTPDSGDYLHAVVLADSPRMLAVMRQIALSAHYLNYHEEAPQRNRTVITLVTRNQEIKRLLESEEYLGNLPKHCKYTAADGTTCNADSYIDIEICITPEYQKQGAEGTVLTFSEEELQRFCNDEVAKGNDIYSIDTRHAIYARRIYNLGALIDNLPAEDIHCTDRYTMALNAFQYVHLTAGLKPLIEADESKDSILGIRETLSNIYCADCFSSRELAIKKISEAGYRGGDIWEAHNKELSKSEHQRWVVEKLILGYSPLTLEQAYTDEELLYDTAKRSRFRKSLKKNPDRPAHIDLCSYNDLRRINPDDLKYDSFLMLAIPRILQRTAL